MKTVPIFGIGMDSYSKSVTAQRRLNCFYDVRPDGEKTKYAVIGTPGALLWQTLNSRSIRGFWVVKGVLYVVSGNTLYSVTTSGVATSRGTLQTSSGYVSMSDNNTQLIIVDGTSGYILTIPGYVFSTITDVNFPAGATTVTFIDGRFLANLPNSRQVYASNSYDGTNWTGPTFFTKEQYSDLLIAVENFNGTIILWGTNSIEFWQDVGAATLPYQRISGSTQTWGLASVWSRAQLNNTEIFLGVNPQGGVKVMMMNGYTPVPISTSDVENIINRFSVFSDAVAMTYTVYGHPMYQITFPTGGRSFLYDAMTQIWYETQTGTDLTGTHLGRLGVVFNTLNLFSDSSTGNIYIMSPTTYTDNGTPIKRLITSMHIRNGGNTFGASELYLDMSTGDGLQSGQGSNPLLMMEVSKDNGRTFLAPRMISMGPVGQYNTRVIARRLGSARDFVFRFTMTDPIPFVITDAALTVHSHEGGGG